MDKEQYQRIRSYQEQKQFFVQMELESAARNLVLKIENYQLSEYTVPTPLLHELEALQYRISLLVQQLKNDL